MSHRWNCPDEWTARREGERAQERGEGRWRNPYEDRWHDGSGCEDAERAWERGYRDAERHAEEREEEARAMRRRQEREREEYEMQHYYESQQEDDRYRQYLDEQYSAYLQEQLDEAFEEHLIATRDIPRWEDDGGA